MTDTDVCLRWAGSSTLSNSATENPTLYYFGGNIKQTQSDNATWVNSLYSIDLSQTFSTGSPKLNLLNQGAEPGSSQNEFPDSPPQVALGALFADDKNNRLIQYGGYYADTPRAVLPGPSTPWQWDIDAKRWSKQSFASASGAPDLERAAEGSQALIPSFNSSGARGFYAQGHLDYLTTEGWSIETPRVFLKSMVSFDFTENTFTNTSTLTGSAVGNTGASNGTAENEPSTFRADNTLSYVPGLGTNSEGLLVAAGGGAPEGLISMTTLDVYDIGARAWVRQPTTGDQPSPRINSCAVVAKAKVDDSDEETTQIFYYGGQNLDQSRQFNDVFVLTLPSYQWTLIGGSSTSSSGDQNGKSLSGNPTGRAGHACELVGSQMLILGGYVGKDILCDAGFYVYDVSESTFVQSYTPGTTYKIPKEVTAAIGKSGSAGVGNGAGTSTSGVGGSGSDASSTSGSSGSTNNIGAIIGGVVGGVVAALLICLAAFLIYRKRQPVRVASSHEDTSEKWVRQSDHFPLSEPDAPFRGSLGHFGGYRPNSAHGSSYSPHLVAEEDPEEYSRNMDISNGAQFVQKGELRITNNVANTSRESL